jgi:hypothetical protein
MPEVEEPGIAIDQQNICSDRSLIQPELDLGRIK